MVITVIGERRRGSDSKTAKMYMKTSPVYVCTCPVLRGGGAKSPKANSEEDS